MPSVKNAARRVKEKTGTEAVAMTTVKVKSVETTVVDRVAETEIVAVEVVTGETEIETEEAKTEVEIETGEAGIEGDREAKKIATEKRKIPRVAMAKEPRAGHPGQRAGKERGDRGRAAETRRKEIGRRGAKAAKGIGRIKMTERRKKVEVTPSLLRMTIKKKLIAKKMALLPPHPPLPGWLPNRGRKARTMMPLIVHRWLCRRSCHALEMARGIQPRYVAIDLSRTMK